MYTKTHVKLHYKMHQGYVIYACCTTLNMHQVYLIHLPLYILLNMRQNSIKIHKDNK